MNFTLTTTVRIILKPGRSVSWPQEEAELSDSVVLGETWDIILWCQHQDS